MMLAALTGVFPLALHRLLHLCFDFSLDLQLSRALQSPFLLRLPRCLSRLLLIALLHRLFAQGLQGRGQALYSSLSFGAGGALGSAVAGWLWAGVGAEGAWLAAAAMAALGGVVASGIGSFGVRQTRAT